jgi:hypothetical protein
LGLTLIAEDLRVETGSARGFSRRNLFYMRRFTAVWQRGGFTEQESLDVIAQLDGESIDLLEISGGTYESPAMSGSAAESTRRREAYFLEFAEAVREITTVPLMVTGGFRSGAGMSDAITTGATDLIGLARPLALEPELPSALVRDPAVTPSSFHLKPLGVKKLDTAAELWWTQHQLRRIGMGRTPTRPTASAARCSPR